jgi:nitrous oxidase accessory protein
MFVIIWRSGNMGSVLSGDCFKRLMSILMVVTLFSLSADAGSAEIIYVEQGDSIQAAVNNSTTGDFVVVKAGNYQENVTINVSGITITSDPENSSSVFLRSPNRNSSVFWIKADNVTLRGFNIKGQEKTGSTSDMSWNEVSCPPSGICLEQAKNCRIIGNNLSENRYGIYLKESMNNIILQNCLSDNGIWIDNWCNQNIIKDNFVEKGSIFLGAHCWDNKIMQNRLSNGEGISIACCGGNNLISKNVIMNCSTGIDIYDVQGITVLRDNQILNCNYGINFDFVFYSSLYNNTISNTSTGIYLREECRNNELSGNMITSSTHSGIYLLENSGDNRIYNNYFNNTINVRIENSNGNSWNTTKKKGANIVKGPYFGGNYWANPKGTGFSQTAKDSNLDGISDKPYKVSGNDFDYLPLVRNRNLL